MDRRPGRYPAHASAARPLPRRGWRGRIIGVFLTLLVVAGLGAGAWWLTQRPAEVRPGGGPGAFRRVVTTVGVAAATKADIPVIIDALGTVTPAAASL